MNDRRSDDTFQREVLTTLGDIRVLCATAVAHHEAVTDRVGKLEHAQDRQWWVTMVVTPLVVIGGSIARAMGVKV